MTKRIYVIETDGEEELPTGQYRRKRVGDRAAQWGKSFINKTIDSQLDEARFRDRNLDHLPKFKSPAGHLLRPPRMKGRDGMPCIGDCNINLNNSMRTALKTPHIQKPSFKMPNISVDVDPAAIGKLKRKQRRIRL